MCQVDTVEFSRSVLVEQFLKTNFNEGKSFRKILRERVSPCFLFGKI